MLLKDRALADESNKESQWTEGRKIGYKAEAQYWATTVAPKAIVNGWEPNPDSEIPFGHSEQLWDVRSIQERTVHYFPLFSEGKCGEPVRNAARLTKSSVNGIHNCPTAV